MRRCSASLFVSVLAVVLALGGTALAGGYIITSARQIKPSVRKALKGNRGPRGYAGSDGQDGATGAPGSPGILSLTTVNSSEVTIPPGSTSYDADPNGMRAQCPPGYTVVGTGANTGIGNLDFVQKFGTFVGGFVDNDTSITIQAFVEAICAQLPPGVAATRSSDDGARFEAQARAAAAALRQPWRVRGFRWPRVKPGRPRARAAAGEFGAPFASCGRPGLTFWPIPAAAAFRLPAGRATGRRVRVLLAAPALIGRWCGAGLRSCLSVETSVGVRARPDARRGFGCDARR